jgi:hypothetical protein
MSTDRREKVELEYSKTKKDSFIKNLLSSGREI